MNSKRDHLLEHVEQVHNKYHELVARAWDDPEFKERLLNDSDTLFRDNGIQLPDGVSVQVHENTEGAWHFVLPAHCEDLSDEELESGEMASTCTCTCCCGYTMALEQRLDQGPGSDH
ncbi:NHLP leader peptide family RiPP precursor [Nonomuraea sp. NPDC004702]